MIKKHDPEKQKQNRKHVEQTIYITNRFFPFCDPLVQGKKTKNKSLELKKKNRANPFTSLLLMGWGKIPRRHHFTAFRDLTCAEDARQHGRE